MAKNYGVQYLIHRITNKYRMLHHGNHYEAKVRQGKARYNYMYVISVNLSTKSIDHYFV